MMLFTINTSNNSGAAMTTIGRRVNHTRYMLPCSFIHLKLAFLSNSITTECNYYHKKLSLKLHFITKTDTRAEYITIMIHIQFKDVS